MEYRSRATWLGLPLVHVATGCAVEGRYQRGVAKGWFAFGDIAFGVFLSCGGIAVGGVALGGVSIGLFAVGGAALGAVSVGGLAAGFVAAGGAAFGWVVALGGLAVAHDYAMGGLAVAREVVQPGSGAGEAWVPLQRAITVMVDVVRAGTVLLLIVLLARVLRGRSPSRPPGRS